MGTPLPRQISRFNILKILGKGAQGTVYLAEDSHLKRQVAIKTMQISGPAHGRESRVRALLDEALISGKLQHPNIVTLYDAGEEGGTPYLVFEYVKGMPLSNLIEQNGKLDRTQAAEIAIQILDALSFAHQNKVVHRDIKPSNILVMENGTARVMDFGIAQHFSTAESGSDKLFGTPSYMAPEYIERKIFQPSADVFAASMVLYEMLTGAPVANCETVIQTLKKILAAEFQPPSQFNSGVDQKLDQIVLKALSKRPELRFANAEQMAVELRNYLNPEVELLQSSDAKQATLDFLLRRIRNKSDFPMLSSTINAVNKITSADNAAVTELANTILKDFGLTNRLLRLVNSPTYSQYGGKIRTVSRTVMILGVQAVRSIASSLALYGHLHNKAVAEHLKDEAIGGYFNGLLAKEIAQRTGIGDAEEAFICAMFHNLGKLLVTFYFHDELLEINHIMQQKKWPEEKAAASVLGISFEELGVGVARTWNLPAKIVNSMFHIDSDKPKQSLLQEDKLRLIAELSCALREVACTATPENRVKKLAGLANRYMPATHLSVQEITELMGSAVNKLKTEAVLLGFELSKSELFSKLRNWDGEAANNDQTGESTDMIQQLSLITDESLTTHPLNATSPELEAAEQQAILTVGVQDITNIIVGEFEVNDVFRIILETMYRGAGFSRVLLAIADSNKNIMKCRFGFGPGIDPILEQFAIPVEARQGVFYAAITKGSDILINDINADSIQNFIPETYRKLFPAETFILLPIVINKKTIGLFYGDKDKAGTLNIPPQNLSLLKALRSQAVLAIKQKR